MKNFDLPLEVNSEDGLPDSIQHKVDYIIDRSDKLEFYYNFINYSWTVEDETISARAYLDDINEVSVFAHRGETATFFTPEKLETEKYAPVLRYLQRRYRVIKTFGSDGIYRIAFKR